MKQHPRVLGVVPINHYPTLVFSSESAIEGTLHPGDYALLYPHWYQVTAQGSLQLVGKTAISARQAPITNVGGWKCDLESLLKGPLDRRLEARQADLPYVMFLDPDRMIWQEETPASFPPDAFVYLELFFYTTDTLKREPCSHILPLDCVLKHPCRLLGRHKRSIHAHVDPMCLVDGGEPRLSRLEWEIMHLLVHIHG